MINLSLPLPQQLRENTFLNIYLPPILWAAVIFILSSQATLPSLSFSVYDFVFKKSAHVFVYGVLFVLINRSLLIKQVSSGQAWKIAMLITLLYAISDELHQSLVPGRYGTLRDIGYDMIGVTLAFLWKYRYI
jgi:VanZ family protein